LAARSRGDARRALGLPAEGKVIAVSGGGWGVGDLLGATRVALDAHPDALVLCLCGRNDRLRARVASSFGDEPRLRVMGFTDRMGDVLAASDALVHSSAGLTVLEAIIRGCPVISYGFGYGHVRASNYALERFGLAQVARDASSLGPCLERALSAGRPEADGSFARRPSTASLILSDERRAPRLPAWRLRTVRAFTVALSAFLVGGWAMTTGASYSLVSRIAHMRPVTAVATGRPEVGVLVDAPAGDVAAVADEAAVQGMHVSFAVARPFQLTFAGDEAVPRVSTGGLMGWLGTRRELHRWVRLRRHFLYASSGPSIGQWLFAHGAGGRLVAGAVVVDDRGDRFGVLRPGEVVELTVRSPSEVQPLVDELARRLRNEHLRAVPVGRLMRDAGASV
jgi:hypothetical protein